MNSIKPIKIAILSSIHGHAPSYYGLADSPFYDLVAYSVVPGYEDICAKQNFPTAPRYWSDEELYANHPDLEAVIIGSENSRHYEQTMEALRRGLHVLTMKVPTMNLEQYRIMMALAKEKGVIVQVELELRSYSAPYRAAELIRSGAIGKLQSINIINYSHNPGWWCPWQVDAELSYGERVPLRPGDDRFRGGALTDHAHPFDLVRMIAGADFDTVYANVTPNIREGMEVEDMIRLIGRMKNGVTFSIDPSYANNEHDVKRLTNIFLWRKYPKIVEVFMTAVGSEGTIISDLYGKNNYLQLGPDSAYHVSMGDNSGLGSYITTNFYHNVRQNRQPEENLEMHYNSIQAMVAGYESVTRGEPVKISDL